MGPVLCTRFISSIAGRWIWNNTGQLIPRQYLQSHALLPLGPKNHPNVELENWAGWDGAPHRIPVLAPYKILSVGLPIDFASVINRLKVYAAVIRRGHINAFLNLYSSFMKEWNSYSYFFYFPSLSTDFPINNISTGLTIASFFY